MQQPEADIKSLCDWTSVTLAPPRGEKPRYTGRKPHYVGRKLGLTPLTRGGNLG